MATGKYTSGNTRHQGIGINELKASVRLGEEFDYTHESLTFSDFVNTQNTRPTKKIERVKVIELWSNLVKLRLLDSGKEMLVSYPDILLYSNKKSLQPFRELQAKTKNT